MSDIARTEGQIAGEKAKKDPTALQAASGAASPYLAEQIHKLTEGNPEAQAMAHAVVGVVTSYASGNSALAGAAGAVTGELMAQLVMNHILLMVADLCLKISAIHQEESNDGTRRSS